MNPITFEESLKLYNPLYVDVRSPGEYAEDHIPGAVNLPIFDNDERREIGTLYRMAGRDKAVLRGTEIGGRRIGDIINRLSETKGREIVIYCARGGMRSGSVASLLDSLGISTFRITDGYKSYRRYVNHNLSVIRIVPQIFILQGLTGAGKTDIIKILENSIDLEEFAGHRSSVFGGIGLTQRTQKNFETRLFNSINKLEKAPYLVIEGESRKVGNLHIPDNIFSQMQAGLFIYIETPIERRISIIREEYARFEEHEKIIQNVNSIRSKLGNKKTDLLIELYSAREIDEFIEILLLEYYDLLYKHSLEKYQYISVINNNDTEEAAGNVESVIKEYLRSSNK